MTVSCEMESSDGHGIMINKEQYNDKLQIINDKLR